MAFEAINLGTQPAGTGGDTARSAFEKTNRNFLAAEVLSAAMSQAQFEAIRAQNNEEFAASGFVHFGKHWSGQQSINEGLYPYTTDSAFSNILFMGRNATTAGLSKTNSPVLNIAGVLFYLQNINTFNTSADNKIKFPQAPDGKNTYNKSTGVITTHATVTAAFNAQAADPTNVEVVTDRVDMWGFEAWLEEVNTTNPYIYPNGLIQSQATTMDGIATSASARPVTYYAVFDGDTGSKGKGLNYFALSDVNKKKVLANPKNNLYYLDDGRLVQWRLRQRTIAGAGNGDWVSVSPVTDSSSVRFSANNDVIPQGILNTTSGRQATQYFYASKNPPSSVADSRFIGDTGVYQIRPSSAELCGINGQCYFLVCGTVNRLNQGAYHPSFNPSGSKTFWRDSGGASGQWYLVPTVPSTARCFDMSKSWNSADNAGYPRPDSGNIGALAGSGRPDGRYYDAIYADGQGGVCRDMRYSAYGINSVDFAEADQRVKNGTYRGFEKLIFSRVTATQNSVPNNSTINFASAVPSWVKVGDTVISVSGVRSKIGSMSANSIFTLTNNGVMVNEPIVIESELPYSVGGSFLQTDVIGNPANILATPALANGWQGSWIPVIPDGTSKIFTSTRKLVSSNYISRVYTNNNGVSYVNGTTHANFSTILNGYTFAEPTTLVHILQYQAFARQTENAVNAEVYGVSAGVGNVFLTDWYTKDYGALLAETLINKILTSNSNSKGCMVNRSVALIDTGVLTSRRIFETGVYGYPVHVTLNLTTPANSSPAFKALNYNVNINQQAFIQYAYTELKHNGSSWGDDGKVTIVDNQSTKTDLNGNTVLVGTAKLKEPIGWIKNKV
ncbi:hypothetical protein [Shewanella xiamenensis]|uniref:hypothetical protein n=1 Tax=Shewanella xiamenensis TaxID=332186 RepID=UPI00313B5314